VVPDASLDGLREVHSHPQALGQCQVYLRTHLPQAAAVPAYDTAGAAKRIAEQGEPHRAAIASEQAAAEYGLAVLAAGIETNHQNYTRFLLLTRGPADVPTGLPDTPYKTSIVYSLHRNVPGGLFKSLAVFALRDIDLFKIESRPLVGSPGQYLFYLDLAGRHTDEPVQRALDHLREISASLKVLGSYPSGRTIG
jgi:prephenate dehydratase